MHPFFAGRSTPLHISHRGGAGLFPENTLLAFERAANEFRTDVIELDVQLTRDSEVVVCHDPLVDRCTDGAGPVSSFTWQELQQLDAGFHFLDVTGNAWRGRGARIPRLVDVLRTFPTMRFNVEVKQAAAVSAFVSLVRSETCLDRLCIGSELDDVAAMLHEALPEALHFFPRDALAALVMSIKGGEIPIRDERYSVMDMPYRWGELTIFDDALAAEAKKQGLWINVWTVDDEADMRTLQAQGVGGIMTDRPDVLRRVLDEAAPNR